MPDKKNADEYSKQETVEHHEAELNPMLSTQISRTNYRQKDETACKYKTRLRSAAIISIHAPKYIRLLYHGNALLYFAAVEECF